MKILLTQYHNDYGQLTDPYWEITKSQLDSSQEDHADETIGSKVDHEEEDPQEEIIAETSSPVEMTPSSTT